MLEEERELSYSHPSRLLAMIGMLIVPLFIVLGLAGALWGIVNGEGYWRKIQGVIGLLTGLYMCYLQLEWVRGWHAFGTTYVVGNRGVIVIERGKEPRHIRWEEFSLGVYKTLLSAVILISSDVERPVVFFNNGMRGVSREFEQVRDLAIRKLGERMRTRWL